MGRINNNNEFSFWLGFTQMYRVSWIHYREFHQKIKDLFKYKNMTSFFNRVHGTKKLTKEEIEAVEKIFAKYGITEIWGQ